MTKEERRRELTKKYFYEQKAKELENVIIVFAAMIIFVFIIVIPGLVIILISKLGNPVLHYSTIIIILFIYSIAFWLESNWLKAKERAREKIK